MTNKTTPHHKDLLLIFLVLGIAAAGFSFNYHLHKKPAAQLEVQVDGRIVATYNLEDNVDVIITGVHGGTNHLIIENGTARISEASCPDKVCVHQGRIQMNGQVIVCLPNRMTATIIAPEE
ncbi:MAG: NusG domain II-containing protein [Brotaphodocola sp.]